MLFIVVLTENESMSFPRVANKTLQKYNYAYY